MVPRLNGKVNPDSNPLPEPITAFQESWITSLNSLGASIGPFIFGYLADRIGRKKSLLLSLVPIMIAFTTSAFAQSVYLFFAARFINGLGAGGVYTVMPILIGEISEDHNRGTLGIFLTMFIATGNLFTYIVGSALTVMQFNLVALIAPAIFMIIFSVFVPESPYYFLDKNMKNEAEKSLKLVRLGDEISREKELQKMQKTLDESKQNKGSLKDIFESRALRKALAIQMFLAVLQEFAGIDIILSNLQTVFSAAGGDISAELSAVIVGFIQVITCVFTSSVVDRLGRRLLLLISLTGTTVALMSMGIFFVLKDDGLDMKSVNFLPILCLVFFIISYNLGLGTVPYALTGELFPQNIKASAATVCVTTNLLFSFATTNVFPYLVDLMGMGGSFILFGCCCVLGFIFTFVFIPETKGFSFGDIQKILDGTL